MLFKKGVTDSVEFLKILTCNCLCVLKMELPCLTVVALGSVSSLS